MMLWDTWKQGFDAWEEATAQYLEQVLRNPSVLGPAGQMLTVAMKVKAEQDKAIAQAWARVGLPTRRDQERTLHALNQVQSRLLDLEEQLADARAEVAALRSTAVAPAAPANEAPSSAPANAAPAQADAASAKEPEAPRPARSRPRRESAE